MVLKKKMGNNQKPGDIYSQSAILVGDREKTSVKKEKGLGEVLHLSAARDLARD